MHRRDRFWAWVFADENRRYWSYGATILVVSALLYVFVDIWVRFD